MSQVRDELQAIQDRSPDGMLHAEDVVEFARTHKTSALHGQFEWDVKKAAMEHWLWQARRLVQIYVVSGDGKPLLVSLTLDRSNGGGYRKMTDVVASKPLSQIMLDDALRELQRVRTKYERVSALTAVWTEIDRVVQSRAGEVEEAAAS